MPKAVAYNLHQLLLAVGQFLGDALLLRSTQQSLVQNQFVAGKLGFGKGGRYVGSELWVWDLPPDATGDNPYFIANSTSDGTLTLTEPVGVTPFVHGARAVLQNQGGRGFPHQRREWAIQSALIEDDWQTGATATIAAPDNDTGVNPVPAGLRSVYAVYAVDPRGVYTELAPARWQDQFDPTARTIKLPLTWDDGTVYELRGRADLAFPWATSPVDYATPLQVDPARVVKEAVQWLSLGNRDPRQQAIGGNLYNDRLRTTRQHPRPSEIFLE